MGREVPVGSELEVLEARDQAVSWFRPEFIDQARLLLSAGVTDTQLAAFFQHTPETIKKWREAYPKFDDACVLARASANARVTQKLYEAACGYEHPEDRIFCTDGEVTTVPTTKHYAPDVNAARFWLANQDREHWKPEREAAQDQSSTRVGVILKINLGLPDAA